MKLPVQIRRIAAVSAIASIPLLAACNTPDKVWNKPGASQADFARDMSRAKQQAKSQSSSLLQSARPKSNSDAFWSGVAIGLNESMEVNGHMRAMGWDLVEK